MNEMAQEEHSFSHCHYSFLSRILQPFHKHHSHQTLQANALVEGNMQTVLKNGHQISKSTVDLNSNSMKSERLSIRQIGQYTRDLPSINAAFNGVVSKPNISGVCLIILLRFPKIFYIIIFTMTFSIF